MHYIRLLSPPSLDKKNNLKLVLTITTDLGDSFLSPPKPVPISVYAHTPRPEDAPHSGNKVKLDDGSVIWKSGLRVLKLNLPLGGLVLRRIQDLKDADKSLPKLRIVASRELLDPPPISEIPFDHDGRILGISASCPWSDSEPCYTATRTFSTYPGGTLELHIDEEIGESIDRHVWDAGVVTTGLAFDMCRSQGTPKWNKMPQLRQLLSAASVDKPLNVLELGCGVGILGIGLATALSSSHSVKLADQLQPEHESSTAEGTPPEAADEDTAGADVRIGDVLLTDLPDAEEMTLRNIEPFTQSLDTAKRSIVTLTFESLDWDDGKTGTFGPQARTTAWDLIIISDCTYNVDMIPALVQTLSHLHKSALQLGETGLKVMLATKPRHSSEKALFDLMDAEGWAVVETASQPLPALGMDNESVEIFLFAKNADEVIDRGVSHISASKRRKLG